MKSIQGRIWMVVLVGVVIGWRADAAAEANVFPGKTWEEATPQSQGVDPVKLREAIALLQRTVGKDGARKLVIVRHGRMIWKGVDIDRVHGVWSVTKSFTGTVLGLLIDDGKGTLDTRAAALVPELAAYYPDATLRHFATMTSGYRAVGDEPQGDYRHGPSRTPFLPARPLFSPPGLQFAYWDSAMNVFALALTRLAGESLEQLLKRRIADPIGMNPQRWRWGVHVQDRGVAVNGGAGNNDKDIAISAREAARFGLLFLNKGRWNGRQLISARWVEEATRVQVPAEMPWAHPESGIDRRGSYGFNWSANGLGPDGTRTYSGAPQGMFWAAGHNNNRCFIIPEWNMVIVRLGLDGNPADHVWNDFLASVGEAVKAGDQPRGGRD